jgi:hypothetical protein
MTNRFGTYRKTRETLPLEGGGKRVGVERPDGHSKKTQETLYRYRTAFMDGSQGRTDGRFQVSSSTNSWQIGCGF